MTAQGNSSVEELRRESERSRAALTTTVVELREKVSDTADHIKTRLTPANIKQEVKEYVRDSSGEFFHSIERKARENPLQAVAIGAALSYPLWGVVRSFPLPIMLVGAGLWLSRQKPVTSTSLDDIAAKVSEVGSEGAGMVSDAVRDAGNAIGTTAENLADKVRATSHDLRDSVSGFSASVVDSMRESATGVTDTMSDTVSDLGAKAVELSSRSRNALEDLVDRNPLLVAGVGLAIGAFIAASLPRSDTEDRMFGDRSDEFKDDAREAVSRGVEHAKAVAAGIADDVTAAASQQGLDAEGLNRSVKGVTEAVKSVVDKGIKTALGEDDGPSWPDPSHKPNQFQTTKN